MQKLSGLDGKARIQPIEGFKKPDDGEHVLFSGTGTNLKTGKEISFKVPDTISKQGLENIAKNIRLPWGLEGLVYELQDLYE